MEGLKDGRRRVVIEGVGPELDCGRFPIKRALGEEVTVEADVFADGHDAVSAVLLSRHQEQHSWLETRMEPLGNDRWRGTFTVEHLGRYCYTIQAWVSPFKSWLQDLDKKRAASLVTSLDLLVGADLIDEAAERATSLDATLLRAHGRRLRDEGVGLEARLEAAFDPELARLLELYPDRTSASTYERELEVLVDRQRARFGSWYEFFPRSTSPVPGRHGTLADAASFLEYVAGMGFDVVYLPPIHPIGCTHRKGKNNRPTLEAGDPGSPWAIGSQEGGHDAIHPALGTLDDFRNFLSHARGLGLEVALDLAYHCSPDHPYVRSHPGWFRQRPDGGIQYAENPPKEYEDIYPFDFDTPEWPSLWQELARIVRFWIGQGIYIFRVDNPHTKPFPFWESLIADILADHPEVILLSEAFTRPKVMYRLAKIGFNQSYTYFAWRNSKWELTEYFTELTQTEVREFFRPSLWTNTPDILTEYLQTGGRPAFMIRLVLAATLSASYGIYGPAFELLENRAREAGSEEYLDSEKYEIRYWDLERPDSLRNFIARVNSIRRENPALQSDWSLLFHPIDNEHLICYSKSTPDRENVIIVAVNLDPFHTHHGWVHLSLDDLGIDAHDPYQVHDLLSEARYWWQGPHNYIELSPGAPAHVFRVPRHVVTEEDFAH